MKGPPPPKKKPKPITILDILFAAEEQLAQRAKVRDVCQEEWGPDDERDREITLLSEACKIVYYVSCDPEGYRELAQRVLQKYPRWLPLDQRGIHEDVDQGANDE